MSLTGGLLLIILHCNHVVHAGWDVKGRQKVRVSDIISLEKDISLISCQVKCNLQKECYKIGTDKDIDLGMIGDCYLLRKIDYSDSRQSTYGTSIVIKEMYVYRKHDLCENTRCRNDQKCVVTEARSTCVCKNGLTTNDCKYPLSCDAIKQSNPKTPSGFYTINPSKPVSVYCDMDIDTIGWMLIANVTLPNPITKEEAITLSSLQSLSNDIGQLNQVITGQFRFNPVRLADFDASFQYLHFYCKRPGGRTISISTVSKNVLDYFMLKTNSKPVACSSFKRLTEDSSRLGKECFKWMDGKWGGKVSNGNRLYAFPFYVSFKSYYGIYRTRIECDDMNGKNVGVWRIYVR